MPDTPHHSPVVHAAFAANGEASRRRCENSTAKPPRTAVCITGAARGFSSPLVLGALRHHLLASLGPRPRLFLQLKTHDSDKFEGWFGQYKQHSENVSGAQALRSALNEPWLARHIGEAMLIHGNGSFLGSGEAAGEGNGTVREVAANGTLHLEYRPVGGACASAASSFLRYRDRQLLLYLGMKWCRDAILRSEAASGDRYDAVVFSRPDLVWWRSPTPWCERDPATRGVVTSHLGSDQVWSVPRAYMDTFLLLAHQIRDCNATTSTRSSLPQCCGQAEDVLAHTLTLSNMPLAEEALGSFTPNTARLSLLRSVQGVCEVVTHPYYLNGRYANDYERGALALPIRTGVNLRGLFMGVNATKAEYGSSKREWPSAAVLDACRQAIGATPCGRKSHKVPCGWGEKF